MARRPRVAVTGNARAWSPGWWCAALALRLAGAEPFRVSVDHSDEVTPVQAIVIGGGDDIGTELYGGDRALGKKGDPARDRLEMSWIERGLKEGLPLLGICRGAQLLNVVLGGTLHQDLRPLRRLTHNCPGLLPTKSVALEEGTALAAICGTTSLRVNSLHRQAVDRTGRGLRVVGRDRDGIVQAVEGATGKPLMGVQWHPEYLLYLPAQFSLFRWISVQAQNRL